MTTTSTHPSFPTAAGRGPDCNQCGPGHYSPWTTHNCTLCSAGKYSSTSGASTAATCIPCPGGRFSTASRASCNSCLAGKYMDDTGNCARCSGGKFSADDGQTSCLLCEEGQSTSNSIGQSACTACRPGRYSNSGAVNCSSCPEEYYKQESGSTECYDCSDVGIDCEAGEYNICGSASGFASSGTCLSCPPGKYLETGKRECSLCAEGEYSAATGTECIACEAAKYQSSGGSSYCLPCLAGSITNTGSATGAISCASCPATKYSNDINLASCTRCPVGKWQQRSGRSFCDDVTPGKRLEPKLSTTGQRMVDDEGQPVMQEADCSAGKYNRGGESGDCAYCPVGYVQALGGRSSCDECSKASQYIRRMTTLQPDNQTCVDCPKYGVTCDGSVKRYNGGYWHTTSIRNPRTDTNIYTCITNGCPDKGATEMACKQGYEGPLCAVW
jgi:hypothetical protein